jgi:ribosomal protein L16 Arg81 hydroxylase
MRENADRRSCTMLKRTLASLVVVAAAALAIVSLAAAASPNSAGVLIRHQVRGCHAWSVNGGPFKASQTIGLARNASLTVTNNDLMPHKLVQVSGPAAVLTHVAMGHMGAVAKVKFPSIGVYRFTTKPGEDYTSGVKTIGDDNVLVLVVRVR